MNYAMKAQEKLDNAKTFKVYHTHNWALNSRLHFVDLDSEFKNGYKPFKSNYKHVATVRECDGLNTVFHKTNHLDTAWWENWGVELVEQSRSTSVGDLVEDGNGKLWMVASMGFDEVEWADEESDPYEVHTDEYGSYLVPKTN